MADRSVLLQRSSAIFPLKQPKSHSGFQGGLFFKLRIVGRKNPERISFFPDSGWMRLCNCVGLKMKP